MLLFMFIGFLVGFLLSLRFVQRPRKALIWGVFLGGVPFAIMFGPGTAPVQGIGSMLNFAFFALGPLMIVPFAACSAALGMSGASMVLMIGRQRPRWVRWTTGATILGLVAAVTLLPFAQRQVTDRQLESDRDTRAQAIMRADFKGTLAGYPVAFPASPRLQVIDTCTPGIPPEPLGCATSLANPVTSLTKPDEVLLHERNDPLRFQVLTVNAVEPNCGLGDFCLTQEKIDRWCRDVRPDQADSIWCRDEPPMQFSFRTDATPGPSDREEPELSAQYADTVLGPAQITCFYSPNANETDRQGVSCRLIFDVADGVSATVFSRRALITTKDPALTQTIALIPEYWATLTGSP